MTANHTMSAYDVRVLVRALQFYAAHTSCRGANARHDVLTQGLADAYDAAAERCLRLAQVIEDGFETVVHE